MKSIITSLLGRHVSTNKVDAILHKPKPQVLNRDIKKRIFLVLINEKAEPFTGSIGDQIDAIGIDLNVWLIESLNPIVALSADIDPYLLNLPALVTTCRQNGLRFVAAVGNAEFGVIGSGIRMSYGSVTAMWTILITAALQLDSVDSWISSDLAMELCQLESEPRNINGTVFYRMEGRLGRGHGVNVDKGDVGEK